MNTSTLNKSIFCFFYLVLSLNTEVHGQTITPETLVFNKICAGKYYNQFDAAFTYSGFPAGTTFEVQLSNNLGNYSPPVSTKTLSTSDIANRKTITFELPTTLIGSDNYKLRVKSSTGVLSGNFLIKDPNNTNGTLNYFTAYYKPFEEAYFINNQISTAAICKSGSITLSIDNPTPSIAGSSPVQYPNIKYKWFKGSTLIPGQTGSSINVTTADTYYVAMDYASCTDTNSQSNIVTVTENTGGTSGSITSSLGNPFCNEGTPTTLSSSIAGNTYQWYKDKAKIDGATNITYSASTAGKYEVAVNFGGCENTFFIDLKMLELTSSINIPDTSIIIEGETKNVVASTNAVNPSFNWYKNNTLIPEIKGNTYDVTSAGSYKVIITQKSGCKITDEKAFVVNAAVDSNISTIPNLISPNNDGKNDTWAIPQEYSVGSNTEVVILNATGDTVFKSTNYLNNWPENPIEFKTINPVYYYIITKQDGKVKKGSITIIK